MRIPFIDRTTFLSSVIDFPNPTVLIAEIEKNNLICQSNDVTMFSSKEFLEKLVSKVNVKGGGTDRQIQCSIKDVENVFITIKSILEDNY